MRGAIPPLPQYASMGWCSVKALDNDIRRRQDESSDGGAPHDY